MLHKYKECKKCGKTFLQFRNSELCPECRNDIEQKFQLVKDYLQDYPGSNIAEISDATDIEEKLILQWQEEGRLIKSIKPAKRCEVCNRPIKQGRICKKCLNNLKSDDISEQETDSEYLGMHIYEKNKK